MEVVRPSVYGHVQTNQQSHPLHMSSCLPLPQNTTTQPLPLEHRQNPRRCPGNTLHKPPTLVRQEERKASFVDGLVDSATQMVEVIWPLSAAPCRPQAGGVLSLRRYIEETLRRSRTSYSTLQVALYYLVLIMPFVPKSDFTMQQPADSSSARALQCGRRMFLTALILASKYLQDRNYSAKAWSKMSGLKVAEINLNELAFLEAVDWKLHIPDCVFKRWTDVVLRYTPTQFPPPLGQSILAMDQSLCWKKVIPMLTPQLEKVAPSSIERDVCVRSVEIVAPYSELPSFLEPRPEVVPPTPAFVGGISYLPTPRTTPQPVNTPAVSVASVESSMGRSSRRSSLAPSEVSTVLSPASMISDSSSRLSRSSSVSSVSTGVSSQAYQQATCLKKPAKEARQRLEIIHSPFETDMMVSSPMSLTAEQSLVAYDAQPQKASRALKRSRSYSFDTEDECELQTRVRSLLKREASKKEDFQGEEDASAAEEARVAAYKATLMSEDGGRKRRCLSVSGSGEKSFQQIAAY